MTDPEKLTPGAREENGSPIMVQVSQRYFCGKTSFEEAHVNGASSIHNLNYEGGGRAETELGSVSRMDISASVKRTFSFFLAFVGRPLVSLIQLLLRYGRTQIEIIIYTAKSGKANSLFMAFPSFPLSSYDAFWAKWLQKP